MAEMFGVSDAEVALRPNYMQRVQAQEIMGRIAMQPAQLREHQARAQGQELQNQERLDEIRKERALKALGRTAMANGRIATMEDARDVLTPRSAAADLEEMYRLGREQGMSAYDLADVSKQIAEIKGKEATTGNQASNKRVHELTAAEKVAERQGALARAALQSPQAYATLRMQTGELNHLPQSFEMAKPFLENLVNSSISAQVAIDQQRKEERNEDLRRAADASKAKLAAQADAAQASADLRRQRFDIVKKNGGAADPSAVEARREATKGKKIANRAAYLKLYPPVPIRDQRELGKEYSLPDGRRARWVLREDTGEPALLETYNSAAEGQ